MKRLTIAATLLLSLAVAVAAGPAAQDAVAACNTSKAAAYDNPADGNNAASVFDMSRVGQSFTLTAPITLTKVGLFIGGSNPSSGPIIVEIRADSGGNPGAVLGSRMGSPTNNSPALVEFDFSSDRIALSAGTTYYIVAHTTGGNYSWATDTTNSQYPGGKYYYSSNPGSGWTNVSNWDALFQVFGQACTADTQQQQTNTTLPEAAASNLAFSNPTFAAEGSGPSATSAKKKKPHRGTRVSFKLNEAAKVRFTVTQRLKGRKVKKGKKTVCAKPTKKNRKKKSCTRVVTLKGSFSRNGVAGKNSFHFTGRLNGRKLKPGRYRLVATPSAGGKKGKPTSSGFRVVR